MAELGAVASAVLGMGALYWIVALGAVGAAAYFPASRRSKAVAATAVLVLFWAVPTKLAIDGVLHARYARDAWAHFKKLCAEKSGEKIYKTFTGVKSVLVVKPLPPATEKDLYDQYWYGDPYSDASTYRRTEASALRLASKTAPVASGRNGVGYDFVELPADSRQGTTRFFYSPGSRTHETSRHESADSRFGISWEDVSTPEDRKHWIAGSRLRVMDLSDNSVVAERFGYLIEAGFGSTAGQRRPWQNARGIGPNQRSCPEVHDWSDRWFLLKVLKPGSESSNGK